MTHLQANPKIFEKLKGKVVVLTGGAVGIGASAVESFASHGAHVVFGDVNDKAGHELAHRLGQTVAYQHCDASCYKDQLSLFQNAKTLFGRVDIAVGNAGVCFHHSLFARESDWKEEPSMAEIEVNLKGAIYTARIAQGHFRDNPSVEGGDIVLTSSLSGWQQGPGIPTYTASKHGIVGLLRGLHQDMIKENIRINVVGPWMTRTSMTEFFADHWISEGMPCNSPADVASAILMCSTANRGGAGATHTGAVLPFTGKIVFVGGGKSYEIEDRLQSLQPQWFGEENTKGVALGDIFLSRDGFK